MPKQSLSVHDLMIRALDGEPVTKDETLAIYADPSNWSKETVKDEDGRPYCAWVWRGPVICAYEAAKRALGILVLCVLASVGVAPVTATPASAQPRSVVIQPDPEVAGLYGFRLDGVPYAALPSADLRRAGEKARALDSARVRLATARVEVAAARIATETARDSLAAARAAQERAERETERLGIDLDRERDAARQRAADAEARQRETEAALRRQRVKTLAYPVATAALVYTACRLIGC